MSGAGRCAAAGPGGRGRAVRRWTGPPLWPLRLAVDGAMVANRSRSRPRSRQPEASAAGPRAAAR